MSMTEKKKKKCKFILGPDRRINNNVKEIQNLSPIKMSHHTEIVLKSFQHANKGTDYFYDIIM